MFRTIGLLFIGVGVGTILGWVLGFKAGEQDTEDRIKVARRIEREHR